MDQRQVLGTILGMALVTYLPRFLPAWLLSGRRLPDGLRRWLGFVPVAVFGAMLLPMLVLQENRLHLGLDNTALWAGLATALFARRSGSFLGTILAGIGMVALSRYFQSGA